MARGGAAVRGEAQDEFARQLHGLGRSQVVRDDYRGDRESLGRIVLVSGKRLEKPALYVVDVADALAEVGIVHARELRAGSRDRLLDSGRGVQAVLAYVAFRLPPERLVLEEHLVALEDPDVPPSGALLQDGYKSLEVAMHVLACAVEPKEFVVLPAVGDDVLGDGDFPVAPVYEDRTGRVAACGRQPRYRRWTPIAHPGCRTCARREPRARREPSRRRARRPSP